MTGTLGDPDGGWTTGAEAGRSPRRPARLVGAVRDRPWAVVVLSLVLVLVVSEAGVLLLAPRGGIVAPDGVPASAYFTAEQVARAAAYRGPQVPIQIAQTLLGIAALAWLVARPPRWLRDPAAVTHRVLLRVAGTGAGLALLLTVVALPLRIVNRFCGIEVGLITRSWGGWVVDVAMGAAIQALLWAVAAVVLIALARRFPRRWLIPASGFVTVAAVVVVFATPLVIDPLFNRFASLEGPLRTDVEQLAERAGVDVGEVYVMDASRRTTAANAYVTGLGHSKRVVLYDTLVENYSDDEIRLVVAHELAHQRGNDVRNGILYVILVGPACLVAITVVMRRLVPGRVDEPDRRADARSVPALALAIAVVVPVVMTVSNQLSRQVEARADTVALELTNDSQALVDFRLRSALRNVSEPNPRRLGHVLFGTHPTALERIGAAEAWRRGVRP